jgi:hypothetical protein
MGTVSALSQGPSPNGVPERMTAADFVKSLRAAGEVAGASWQGDAGDGSTPAGALEPGNHRDLVQAVAIVAKAALDEARDQPHVVKSEVGNQLILLAGAADSLPSLQSGPDAAHARAVDFVKGGKGLKLIWAAFVLDIHRVHTWTHSEHRASVGFRIPLVQA